VCEIYGSHGGEYVGGGRLGCDAVWTCAGTSIYNEHISSNFRAEDGGSIFLRNVFTHLQVCTASQPRIPPSAVMICFAGER
jgi:hypothetical protein